MRPPIIAQFLRHELAVLRADVADLEHNPTRQWVYHRKMTWFWLVAFVPVVTMGVLSICDVWLTPTQWAAVLLLFNLVMSCYANFATEFDAVGATDAARRIESAAGASSDVTLHIGPDEGAVAQSADLTLHVEPTEGAHP